MSTTAVRRRRRRPTAFWLRAVATGLVGLLLFLLGIGLGQALDEAPDQGTRTQVRTLRPLPLAPARETVTVTVSTTGP
ncbi:MAG: hypothetical protein ACM33B_03055 [Pseudomonadota bacterium]